MSKRLHQVTATLAAILVVSFALTACSQTAASQPPATTTPESAAPAASPQGSSSQTTDAEAVAEQACPGGEFHDQCVQAVRETIPSGLPFAICAWPDGKWALTTPNQGDAVGSPCGDPGGDPEGGTVTAVVEP